MLTICKNFLQTVRIFCHDLTDISSPKLTPLTYLHPFTCPSALLMGFPPFSFTGCFLACCNCQTICLLCRIDFSDFLVLSPALPFRQARLCNALPVCVCIHCLRPCFMCCIRLLFIAFLFFFLYFILFKMSADIHPSVCSFDQAHFDMLLFPLPYASTLIWCPLQLADLVLYGTCF